MTSLQPYLRRHPAPRIRSRHQHSDIWLCHLHALNLISQPPVRCQPQRVHIKSYPHEALPLRWYWPNRTGSIESISAKNYVTHDV
jgi:hypothetical protein